MAVFVMMVGLQGSGKSSVAKHIAEQYPGTEIISTDSIREELCGTEADQSKNIEVFSIATKRIKDALSRNKDNNNYIIFDACNISLKQRVHYLRELKKFNCKKLCVFCYKPIEDCIADNNKRDRVVPERSIRNYYKSINIPHYFEGWDDIVIMGLEFFNDPTKELEELFHGENGLCKISHDNPHHTLTIGKHCIKCAENVARYFDPNLYMAALLHDIGKPYVKSFKDAKGLETNKAHYYQHHIISAYESLPYLGNFNDKDVLEIATLIQYHMHPYFWEKDNNNNMLNKYKNLWGDELFEKIMRLHSADRFAN